MVRFPFAVQRGIDVNGLHVDTNRWIIADWPQVLPYRFWPWPWMHARDLPLTSWYISYLVTCHIVIRRFDSCAWNFSTVFFYGPFRDRNGLSYFSNGLSKYSGTSLQNYYRNTLKPRFVTISVFRQCSCGLLKCLNGQQGGQTLQSPVSV